MDPVHSTTSCEVSKRWKGEAIKKGKGRFLIRRDEEQSYIYLHNLREKRDKESYILSLLKEHGIIAPRVIEEGTWNDFFYIHVTDIGMETLEDKDISDYEPIAKRVYATLQKLHSIRYQQKRLVHCDLYHCNIGYDGDRIGLLDVGTALPADPIMEYTWIFLARIIFRHEGKKDHQLYDHLWNLFRQEHTIDPEEMVACMHLFRDRFNGELKRKEHIFDRCVQEIRCAAEETQGGERRWIRLTEVCDNRCLFCHDCASEKGSHMDYTNVSNEIEQSKEERIVLSGGEPTLYPNLIPLIRDANLCGKEVQIITNARRFADSRFAHDCVDAGLHEVTLSIHGDTTIHDTLTGRKDCLADVEDALQNLSGRVRITIDTVLTAMNHNSVPSLVKSLHRRYGIRQFNLIGLLPQGRAAENHRVLFCPYETFIPSIHETIRYAESNNLSVWVTRIPPQYLEGFEQYFDEPRHVLDEIRTHQRELMKRECEGWQCGFCPVRPLCNRLYTAHDDKNPKEEGTEKMMSDRVELTTPAIRGWIKRKTSGPVLFSYPEPPLHRSYYRKIAIPYTRLIPLIRRLARRHIGCTLRHIPPCIYPHQKRKGNNNITTSALMEDFETNAREMARTMKMKRLSCKSCRYNNECEGFFVEYARLYGMDEFKPVS